MIGPFVRIKSISPAVWAPGMSFLTGPFLPVEVTTIGQHRGAEGSGLLKGHGESTDMALPKSSQPWCMDNLLPAAQLLPDSPSCFHSIVLLIVLSNAATFPCPAFSSSWSVFAQSQMGRGSASVGPAMVLGWGWQGLRDPR